MKYLLRFKKYGKSVYISHNDTLEEIERMFRRAKINLEYTKGFHAKPKLSISQAVPLGYVNRVLFVLLNTKDAYNFSNFNNYVSEGFKLIEYKSVEENYKLKIKYYLFRTYISKNLFEIFYEKVEKNADLKNKFLDLEYTINKNEIYVLKYKHEYNKIYNIWKVFNEIKENFIFNPILYDVVWGD
ncbi:radical SAM-linked protein [Marinitoga hydrogenitolerans DSM 16785]|uniref:Radical SAM-linked protein n=1 Tax=Marinitoga hydrogenitolerans (strain DSM 16785 / JCM 12826 / AT1271) TaxID=1122195 RepID=A0A1M4WYY5_MARH1|nr:TIGR03936 family radical SAM-associated protein [Marinitoga hydrogenitolerans]SHE86273.1 radical SAM-linked protein [Marinitoga hydrogenitolerans DSM 16785]